MRPQRAQGAPGEDFTPKAPRVRQERRQDQVGEARQPREAGMTKQQRGAIAQLMREHVKREADDILLKDLLDRERITGKVLADWREEFTRGQEQAAYQQTLREGEEWIDAVLRAIEANEAIASYLKNPPKGPTN